MAFTAVDMVMADVFGFCHLFSVLEITYANLV